MQAAKQSVIALTQGYSIETTPKGFAKLMPLNRCLPENTRVYITHLPGAAFAETVKTAEAIKAQGYTPVPHIGARNLSSETELEMGLIRLNKAGIGDILLLAGASGSAGRYRDSLEILESGLLEQFELHSIGFAGHPEGNPLASSAETARALQIKQDYARARPREYYLMTQFCFIAEPVLQWVQALQERRIEFPVKIGIPGVAGTAAMIKHAKACGVGPSLNFLMRNGSIFRRIFGGMAEPSQLIADLAKARETGRLPETAQLHFYPLGDFHRTSSWANAAAAGKFHLTAHKGIHIEH